MSIAAFLCGSATPRRWGCCACSGAKVEAGGAPLDKPGYFIPPTVLSNCPMSGMRIVDEEQFGPVLPVIPYDSEAEALDKANDTVFGLGGSVWGEEEHAAKVAAQIECAQLAPLQHLRWATG